MELQVLMGFVAREELEAGFRKAEVGVEEPARVVARGLRGDGFIQHASFGGEEVAQAPSGGRDALHAIAFGVIAGLEVGEEFLVERVEFGAWFGFREDGGAAAATAVTEGVLGGTALSSRGPGSRGVSRVGSRTD